ncbi:MAG TPA: methyltransferase domain-containing protein, partial [Ktedonobacterales bacterium]|nr:methyltransferase domain-containing protein [Ktedonobacterales bacterium]
MSLTRHMAHAWRRALRQRPARHTDPGFFDAETLRPDGLFDFKGKRMAETPLIASSYTFDPFARHQFYHDVNESLVRTAIGRLDADRPQGRRVRIVELASGTGAVTELILDELERRGRPADVTGVEPSFEAIAVARERLAGREVAFQQGDADRLTEIVPEADAVFFCNAIHLIPDKQDVIGKIARVLGPRGFFACNSSFFDGAYAPGSERFYHLWTRRALGWLRKNHPDVRLSRNGKVTAMQWLTADDYAALLEKSGLRMVDCAMEEVLMPLRSWQDI